MEKRRMGQVGLERPMARQRTMEPSPALGEAGLDLWSRLLLESIRRPGMAAARLLPVLSTALHDAMVQLLPAIPVAANLHLVAAGVVVGVPVAA